MHRSYVIAAVVATVLLGTALGAHAQPAEPATATAPVQTLDEATERVLDLEEQIDDLRAEQIAIEERISVTNLRIFRQQEILSSARGRLDEARVAYDQRLVRMYKSHATNPLAMLLTSDSFSDFYSRLLVLARISSQDRAALLDASVADAAAQYEAAMLDDLKIQDVELRRIKELRLRELQQALSEQEALVEKMTREAQVILARQRSQNKRTRKQWEDSSIPPDEDVPLAPAIVEPYLDKTFIVADYQPKRYRVTGRTMEAVCSWYGNEFHGRRTASGQIFNQNDLTCASRTLPFGTRLALTRGDRRVVVVVNDRGPFISGRDLDLSREAARQLGFSGVETVHVEWVDAVPEPSEPAEEPKPASGD